MGDNWAAKGEAIWGTGGNWAARGEASWGTVATGLLWVKPTGVWLETVANWAARSEAVRGTVATALSGWHATGEGWQLDFRVEINFKGGTVRADDVTYSPRD